MLGSSTADVGAEEEQQRERNEALRYRMTWDDECPQAGQLEKSWLEKFLEKLEKEIN